MTDTDHAALTYRSKYIKQRLAVLAKALRAGTGTARLNELDRERRSLLGQRADLDAALRKPPTEQPRIRKVREKAEAAQRARQKRLLISELRARTEKTNWFCNKLAAEGEHRQARLHRETIPAIAETIVREFGMPVDLLAEIDPPKVETTPAPADSRPAASAWATARG